MLNRVTAVMQASVMESEFNECILFEKHEKILNHNSNSPAAFGDRTQPVSRRH